MTYTPCAYNVCFNLLMVYTHFSHVVTNSILTCLKSQFLGKVCKILNHILEETAYYPSKLPHSALIKIVQNSPSSLVTYSTIL